MQGKHQYSEKLFLSFQLSDRVPEDNFYRRLNQLDETIDKPLYDKMHQRLQTAKAKRLKKLRSSTVEPVTGTLVGYLAMKRVNTRGLQQANKCMLMAAVAYNLKKLLKHSSNKRITMVSALKAGAHKCLLKLVFCLYHPRIPQ